MLALHAANPGSIPSTICECSASHIAIFSDFIMVMLLYSVAVRMHIRNHVSGNFICYLYSISLSIKSSSNLGMAWGSLKLFKSLGKDLPYRPKVFRWKPGASHVPQAGTAWQLCWEGPLDPQQRGPAPQETVAGDSEHRSQLYNPWETPQPRVQLLVIATTAKGRGKF